MNKEVMRSGNNWLYQSASSRRSFESAPKHLHQQTQIRVEVVGHSAYVGILHSHALLPEGLHAYAPSQTSSIESFHALRLARHRSLNRHSSHSLRSLGPAKAGPLI